MATHTNVPSSVLQSKVVPFNSPQAITQTELVLFLAERYFEPTDRRSSFTKFLRHTFTLQSGRTLRSTRP